MPTPPPSGNTDLVWEDPPRGRARAASFAADFMPLVVQLRRRPATWARLHTYRGATTAGGTIRRFRETFPDCEFRGARLPEGGSAIYGRYVEEG